VAVFSKSVEEAPGIMWTAHQNGAGPCGVYPYEVAETKVKVATEAARENGFPLLLTLEKE
jgi:ATP-dependent Clp protease adaptor protein ClpS